MPVGEEAKKEAQFHNWLVGEMYQHLDKVKQHLWRIEVERAQRYGRTDTIAVKADEVLEGVRKQIAGVTEIEEKLGEEDPPEEGSVEEGFHHSPISAHCEDVLAHPPKCFDFGGIRSFVMCRAWDILEKEKRTKLPVSEAWQEARKVCAKE